MKDFLYDQGPRGITSLAAALRDADPHNVRTIGFEVFRQVVGSFFQDQVSDLNLGPLFDLFRQPHVNLLAYDEFFLALKEELSPARRAAIRQAFRRLDAASEGLVDLAVMLRSFNSQRHPEVSLGTRSAEEVLEEFADTLKDHISFRRGQRSYPTNLVAWEEFEDYYKSISGCFASDEEFCGVLEKVWDLNKAPDASVEGRAALARPAAGAPAKVRTGLHHWQTNTLPTTVTHHKVEMVTKIEDVMQRSRSQIARRGLRAAVDVVQHFYSADDDIDDQLDTYEFRQACRKAGLSFREAEEVSIFEACAETKGKIQLPAFFKLLHGEISPARRSLVERAFAALGGDPQDPGSLVSPATLKERFVAQAHPLVVRGQLDPGYVLAEFLDTFSQLAHVLGGCENGMVSFADFLAYYGVVSSTVENDSLFDLIVQRVWDVPKVREAWAEGGGESPRRSRAALETPASPMAERKPPPHAGPSAYAVESPRGPKQDHRRFGRGPQASAITKSSIVFDERGSSLTEVLDRLRRSIALRGLRGWVAVVQRFQNADYRRNGTIMRLDWQRLNRVLGLGLSPEDQTLLFQELSQKKKGAAMDYLQCLELLRGDLPQERGERKRFDEMRLKVEDKLSEDLPRALIPSWPADCWTCREQCWVMQCLLPLPPQVGNARFWVSAMSNYTGIVRSFNPHKGWGFIECEETHKQFGSDVFLLKSDLGGYGVSKGDKVRFSVAQSEKGARATDVTVLEGGEAKGDDSAGQLFFGEVRSFNPQKGFGFLSSPATESLFGKDCFFIRSEFGDAWPEPGLHVQFKAKVGERGPIASDVRVLDPPGGRWYGKGYGKGFFQGFFPPMMFGYGGLERLCVFEGRVFTGRPGFGKGYGREPKETDVFFGTVKAINEKGFGHITSEAMTKLYGKDLFAHRTSIEEAKVSAGQALLPCQCSHEAVSFHVSPGPKGAHAVNIQAFDEAKAIAAAPFTGTVKAFNEAKGWGFIDSPAAKPIFMSEVFLHKNELNGSASVGDTVQFMVDVSSGRATAKNVSPVPALGGGAAVTADKLKARFDASSAPQCLLRRKDPQQAEQEFFDAVDFFSEGTPYHDQKFNNFFRMVSAVHEDDDEFRLMTSSAFDVA
ncbi:unnamed protein product [Symbiodinium pilosum]|uniref:CSD domain-containing protein n=1 Tax=Symbiodinium pilosum TaxID=2952 RepID=A0A812IT50_SYMPI|nr:unnamed protein product [Symbiodinium pilosum]